MMKHQSLMVFQIQIQQQLLGGWDKYDYKFLTVDYEASKFNSVSNSNPPTIIRKMSDKME